MTLKTSLAFATASLLALTACVDPNAYPDNPNARAQSGAIIGGLAGALVGAQSDDDQVAKAVVGGVIGAALGGAIGATLDQQAAELRAINPSFTVTNMGDYLIVNMPQDVLFSIDSAALRPDLIRDLQSVGANLNRYPNSRIEVIGHTDNTGDDEINVPLSKSRAEAVADYLVSQGVPAGSVSADGAGSSQPVTSNATADGRAQNRRTEITVN